MKKKYVYWCGIFCALSVLCAFLFVSCGPNVNYIKRVQSLEEDVSSPTTIDELKEAIQKYEERVEDIIQADAQTGIWWKILATRYMDKEMYGEALDAFRNAVSYYPANQNLYYWIGVCAGYMSKASLDFDATGTNSKQTEYLSLSESAYKRALELEPTYARALYGLGVLYTFELDQSDKAIPLLQKLLTIDTKNIDGMFVLARAYYMNYDFQAAIDMYDEIIRVSSSDASRAEAETNKKVVLNALYSE
ncbi:MAG: tetratricopeptide repeat protein [Treponemataceae bacterium]|nr:tetratricopeptide repeat protein [Treponemataceae bacterium]